MYYGKNGLKKRTLKGGKWMDTRRTFAFILSLILGLSLMSGEALSLDYPTREIQLIVCFAAGSNQDFSGRFAAKFGEKYVGKPIVVVNKVGGGGALGFTTLAEAKPDGYTVGLVSPAIITKSYLTKGVTFNKDSYRLIARMNYAGYSVVAKKGSPYDIPLKELVKKAKERSGAVIMGTTGYWGTPDIAQALFEEQAGIKFRNVNFPGWEGIIPALLGDHVHVTYLPPSGWSALYKAGKVNILAMTTEQRDPQYPNVPTFKELGFDIVIHITHWLGAPAKTPDPIINFLADAFKKAFNEQGYKEAVDNIGGTAAYLGPEEATKEWNKLDEIFRGLIKKYDIKPQ